jgi:hypothetical protein
VKVSICPSGIGVNKKCLPRKEALKPFVAVDQEKRIGLSGLKR